ncbi:unnamed protein product [Zymoseptoria tritici ST99CH_3D1]|nr:unnamed protein product [Zymoseptoria tritici ST99CH_3D1]
MHSLMQKAIILAALGMATAAPLALPDGPTGYGGIPGTGSVAPNAQNGGSAGGKDNSGTTSWMPSTDTNSGVPKDVSGLGPEVEGGDKPEPLNLQPNNPIPKGYNTPETQDYKPDTNSGAPKDISGLGPEVEGGDTTPSPKGDEKPKPENGMPQNGGSTGGDTTPMPEDQIPKPEDVTGNGGVPSYAYPKGHNADTPGLPPQIQGGRGDIPSFPFPPNPQGGNGGLPSYAYPKGHNADTPGLPPQIQGGKEGSGIPPTTMPGGYGKPPSEQ